MKQLVQIYETLDWFFDEILKLKFIIPIQHEIIKKGNIKSLTKAYFCKLFRGVFITQSCIYDVVFYENS